MMQLHRLRAPKRLGIDVRRHLALAPTLDRKATSFFSTDETTSCWPQSPGFLGQYIPRDNAGIKVVLLDPREDETAWDEYKTKLNAKYARYGLEAEACAMEDETAPRTVLLALATCLESDEMVGGIRIEGPFDDPDKVSSVKVCEGMPGIEVVQERMRRFLTEGDTDDIVLMEGRGNWVGRKGISNSFARALCHLKWFAGGTHLAVLSGRHTLELYRRIGLDGSWFDARNPSGAPPSFRYPDERYESSHIVMAPDYSTFLDPNTRRLLRCERRELAHARERYRDARRPSSPATRGGDGRGDDDDGGIGAWCPEILLDDDPRVRELREDPAVRMVDHFPAQHWELAEDRLPRVTDKALLQEPPRWVYLPWRNTALRMIGPEGYHLLRTDRNRHKKTDGEVRSLALKSVGVVGMSVGHTCAISLAQEGFCGHMKLADFDVLELPNLNRIPTSAVELGENKTLVTARRIAEIDPYLPVEVYAEGVTEENVGEFMNQLDCVVEECDSLDIKVLTRFEAARQEIPVIMEASDCGVLDVERFDVEPDRPPFHGLAGQSLVPGDLRGLSTDDKAVFVLDILESKKISPGLAVSLMEVDRTISSWSQLARDVNLGGALVAAAVYKLFSDPENLPSGRSRTHLKEALLNLADPLEEREHVPVVHCLLASNPRPPLPDDALEALYVGAECAPPVERQVEKKSVP